MLRAPPPIPKLRPELRIHAVPDGVHIVDRGLGRTHHLEGQGWAPLIARLDVQSLSPRDVGALIQVSLVQAHRMVQVLVRRHLIATPRSEEQVVIRGTYRAFRRRHRAVACPHLTSFEWASPHTVGLARRLRLINAPTFRLQLAAFATFDAFLTSRHDGFAVAEVFATRDAFQLVRPDPIAAHAHLRARVGEAIRAARTLPPPIASVVTDLLAGGFQQLDLDAPLAWARPRSVGRSGSLVDAAGLSFLTAAISVRRGAVLAPDALSAIRAWYRRNTALMTELCFAQAAVLTGRDAPRACPPWSMGS